MNKIYNTNNNDLSIGDKLSIQTDIQSYILKNPNYYEFNDKDIIFSMYNIEQTLLIYNANVYIIPDITTNKTIYFGEDTEKFAKFLENLFGLSNRIPNISDSSLNKISFIIKTSLPVIGKNINLSLPTLTTQWISFVDGLNTPSSSITLFSSPLNSSNTSTLSAKAFYTDSKLVHITLYKNI